MRFFHKIIFSLFIGLVCSTHSLGADSAVSPPPGKNKRKAPEPEVPAEGRLTYFFQKAASAPSLPLSQPQSQPPALKKARTEPAPKGTPDKKRTYSQMAGNGTAAKDKTPDSSKKDAKSPDKKDSQPTPPKKPRIEPAADKASPPPSQPLLPIGPASAPAQKAGSKKSGQSKPSVSHLTAFLVEGEHADFDGILREADRKLIDATHKDSAFVEKHLIMDGDGVIYIKSEAIPTPAWAVISKDYLKEEGKAVVSLGLGKKETGQVILLRRKDGIIGFTFGHQGRYMIPTDVCASEFGRRVAFNNMAAANNPSIKGGSLFIPGVNPTRKNIYYTHTTDFTTLSTSETGAAFIRALAREDISFSGHSIRYKKGLDISALPGIADELLQWHAKTDYKAFEQNADYSPVLETKLKDKLNGKLLAVKKWDFAWPLWLADDFDEGQVSHMTIDASGTHYAVVEDLFGQLRTKLKDTKSLKTLKGVKIQVFGDDDKAPLAVWSAYQFLSFAVTEGGHDYVLNSGQWFRLRKDLNKEITAAMQKHLLLPKDFATKKHTLLKYLTPVTTEDIKRAKEKKKKETKKDQEGKKEKKSQGNYLEDIFNRRVVADSKGSLLLMDRRLVRATTTDPKSDIELCDILTGDRDLVCVKDGHSSASLSHLWAQGLNAAKVLRVEPQFSLRARESYVRFEFAEMLVPHYERHFTANDTDANERKELNDERAAQLLKGSKKVKFDEQTLLGGGYDEVLRNQLITTAFALPPFKDMKKEERAQLKTAWLKALAERQAAFQKILPAGSVKPADFTVVYAIFQDEGKGFHLPFFSRLSLYNAARALEKEGFKWAVIKIDRPSRKSQPSISSFTKKGGAKSPPNGADSPPAESPPDLGSGSESNGVADMDEGDDDEEPKSSGSAGSADGDDDEESDSAGSGSPGDEEDNAPVVLTGSLGGEGKTFHLETVSGEGLDCAFRTLDRERKDSLTSLRDAAGKPEAWAMAAQEIWNALVDGELSPGLYEKFKDLHQQYEKDAKGETALSMKVSKRLGLAIGKRKHANELLTEHKASLTETEVKDLTSFTEKHAQLRMSVLKKAQSKEIYLARVDHYDPDKMPNNSRHMLTHIPGRGQAHTTLYDVLAVESNFNLHVWQRLEGDPSKLELIHCSPVDPNRTNRHALHDGRIHYDKLLLVE